MYMILVGTVYELVLVLQSVAPHMNLHTADAILKALVGFSKRSRGDLGSKVVLFLINYTLRVPFWELSWPRPI